MTYETLDSELINALLADGRASFRSLAEDLDVSVTTISNHLEDLEDDGIIQGYTPIIDYGKLGYDVTGILQLKAAGGSLPDLADRLRAHKQMISVYEVTGDYDIIAIGKFQNTDDMNEHIKELLADADIEESSTSIVLNAAAEHDQFDLDVE